MKILIDIAHPAHVHYFKNFIKIMERKGHSFTIINRNSQIINQLLDFYKIEHIIRNKRSLKNSFLKSLFYLFRFITIIFKVSMKVKPDLFMGFASFPVTFISFLHRKSVILLDDTEHNKINHLLLKPFSPIILTPFYFQNKKVKNQYYFNAFVEQLYLHSKYFKPLFISRIDKEYNNGEYALIRYISYDARHDNNINPIPEKIKRKIIIELSKIMRVFVSLESETFDSFYDTYLLNIRPNDMHNVIANASLFITEGATMASEAGVLGTPYVYINPLQELGYINEQIKSYPLIASKCVNNSEIIEFILKKAEYIPTSEDKKAHMHIMEKATINPTDFIVWVAENFPESIEYLKDNPNYQDKFKRKL